MAPRGGRLLVLLALAELQRLLLRLLPVYRCGDKGGGIKVILS